MLAGHKGAQSDSTTVFAVLAEFERELIRKRTVAGLKIARAHGRKGDRKVRAVGLCNSTISS